MAMAEDRNERHSNLDPITDEAGAHPVGTGVGAAGGGMAGAAAGAFAGPVGAAVGLVAGAVVGGLAGKATAEGINPTVEHAYWRDRYSNEEYVQTGFGYDDYGPAYEYGWSSRGAYPGEFESAEPTLATAWAERRGASNLSWDQARPATRAAWERVDREYAGGYAGTYDGIDNNGTTISRADTVGGDGAMDNDDVVDVLNDLLETCRDGEYGFREVSEHTKTSTLKTTFLQRSNECLKAGSELQSLVVRYGGEVAEGGTTSGALHRGWVSVRGALGGLSDLAMLNECERGEDAALARYRKAVKEEGLPSDVRALIEQQLQGVQRNHDQIKLLRDQEKARS